jgi:hypothetical protein
VALLLYFGVVCGIMISIEFGHLVLGHIICHVAIMSSAMWLPCRLPRGCHVVCHMAAMSFATWLPRRLPTHCPCHLGVMWQVNPWRSLSSQILGFGLGSMGFTPIYDGLRTSWITLTHDKNLRTSREGIRDAQYMTFSNFVIDVILWRNFDDPWRKLTVIDHEIFCSVQIKNCVV